MHSWLIIGIGNTLRRDDGAGWLLAERLAAWLRATKVAVELLCVQQLTPDLAEEIAESPASAIIFADVSVSAAAAQVAPLTAAATAAAGSHQLSPAMLLLLCETLYDRRLPAWLATVPGVDFGHGEGLSLVAEEGLGGVGRMAEEIMMNGEL